MKKEALETLYKHFALVHGVSLKAVSLFDDGDLDFRPRPNRRSVSELLYHMYSAQKTLARAAREGGFRGCMQIPEESDAARMTSVSDLIAYAESCQIYASDALAYLTDEKLAHMILMPPNFGVASAPAWQCFTFAYQEHWHHRGELWIYMSLLGKPYVDIYDYKVRQGNDGRQVYQANRL